MSESIDQNNITTYHVSGENDLFELSMYQNKTVTTSNALTLGGDDVISVKLKLKGLPRFFRINSVKITFHTNTGVTPNVSVYKLNNLVDSFDNQIGYMKVSPTILSFDLTKYAYDGEALFFGLKESYYTFKVYSNTAAEGLKPEITITGVNECLVKDDNSIVSGDIGRAGTYSLNLFTGKLKFTKELFSYGGNLLPLSLSLCYYQENIPMVVSGLPRNWCFNYCELIKEEDNKLFYYAYGEMHIFYLAVNSTDKYYDISGCGYIILKKSDGYLLSNETNVYKEFNSNGLLETIKKVIGDKEIKIQLVYNGTSLTKITDGMGNTVSFTYGSNYVSFMKDINKPYRINFNANTRNLTSIVEPNNRTSYYSFSTANNLIFVSNDNQEELVFSYEGESTELRVKRIKKQVVYREDRYIKEEYNISYEPQRTKICNLMGVQKAYHFTEDGKLNASYEYKNDDVDSYYLNYVTDYSRYRDMINTNNYLVFLFNGSISYTLDSGQVSSSGFNKVGTFNLSKDKTYLLNVIYNSKDEYVGNSDYTVVSVLQNNEELISLPLTNIYKDIHATSLLFTLNDTSDLKVIVKHSSNQGNVIIKSIKVYKCLKSEEVSGINLNTGLEVIGGDGNTWFKMDNMTGISYGNNIILNEKMTMIDINASRLNLKRGSNDLWVNHKRKLIANATNVKLTFGNYTYELIDLMSASIILKDNQKTFNYLDFSANDNLYRAYKNTYFKNKNYVNYCGVSKDFLTVCEKDYHNIVNNYTYDAYGNLIKRQKGTSSSYFLEEKSYENYKYLTTDKEWRGASNYLEQYSYNGDGSLKEATNKVGLNTNYEYNLNDDLLKVEATIDSLKNQNTIGYNNDLINKLSHNNCDYTFSYDKYNEIATVKYQNSTLINITNSLLSNSSTQKISYANDYNETYLYDRYKRLQSVKEGNSTVLTYYYSDSVNPTSLEENTNEGSKLRKIKDLLINNTKVFYYDEKDRLIKETNNNATYAATEINYSYDNVSRISQKTLKNTNIETEESYQYKGNDLEPTNEIASVHNYVSLTYNGSKISRNYSFEKGYDALERVIKHKTILNNYALETNYSYITSGAITTGYINYVTIKGGYYTNPNTQIKKLMYTYDALGNIKAIANVNEYGVPTNYVTYTYDSLGRLVSQNDSSYNIRGSYTYDASGNLVSKTISAYNGSNPKSYSYSYDSSKKDRLIKVNNDVITYDAYGNMLTNGAKEYSYSKGTLLASYQENEKTINFTYDACKKRIKKESTDGSHIYSYDGDKLIKETITKGTETYELNYVYAGDELIGFTYKNKFYQYLKNTQNDIITIYNDSNNLVASYVYDAWGNHKVYNSSGKEITDIESTNAGMLNPFRYRGYYYDKETKLYYCETRYYDPELCRWISPDSFDYLDPESINGLNLYCYCYNNPISYSDPSGNLPQWAMWVIGGVVIAGLAIATIATGGAAGGVAGFILAGALKGAIVGAVSGALVNGTISGISSTVDGEDFWSGFFDGAAHGFMSGAVVGGITGAISSGAQVYNASKLWANTGNKTAYKQMVEHYGKHVIQEGQKSVAKNIVNYSKQASQFFVNNSSSGAILRQGVIKITSAPGGIFNIDGLIRSFWYI